jgi:hypothetical protein
VKLSELIEKLSSMKVPGFDPHIEIEVEYIGGPSGEYNCCKKSGMDIVSRVDGKIILSGDADLA